MVLVVAAYPDAGNEKDGLMQRVAAIDSVLAGGEREYLLVSYKRCLFPRKRQVAPGITLHRVNMYLHLPYMLYLASRASKIYVHSLYYATRVLPYYLLFDVVTDMHGLIPEELAMQGSRLGALYFKFVEKFVVRRSKAIVTVTEAMAKHFRDKYALPNLKIFNLPIFETVVPRGDALGNRERAEKYSIIYAGGTQTWQNVDVMIDAAQSAVDRHDFIFLSGDLVTFRKKLAQKGIEKRVLLKSVPKREVFDWYHGADFGFVLRDDVLVNNVACPTKLVEYLCCGVVPIVLQPNIGDFVRYDYSYVLLSDLLSGKLPDRSSWEMMVKNNRRVVRRYLEDVEASLSELTCYLEMVG